MPTSLTDGVRVSVQSIFLPHESSPSDQRYVFAYTIEIRNEGQAEVQLRSRHWVITDSFGRAEEVRGPGVVGKQPLLAPGEAFAYTSSAVLRTEWGTMNGEYNLTDASGSTFDAEIPAFMLSGPGRMNDPAN